jgi:hypothetical protein
VGNPEGFKILCYLAWCGAEATYGFANQRQFDAARAFLGRTAKIHLHGDELPLNYSKATNDYYLIEKKDREAFTNFMQRVGRMSEA